MTTPINVDPAALQRVRDFTNVLFGTGAPHQQSIASDLNVVLGFIDNNVPQLVSERDTAVANSLHNIGARDNFRDALRYVRDQLKADKVDTGFVTAYINETLDETPPEPSILKVSAGVTSISEPIAVAEHQTISGNDVPMENALTGTGRIHFESPTLTEPTAGAPNDGASSEPAIEPGSSSKTPTTKD